MSELMDHEVSIDLDLDCLFAFAFAYICIVCKLYDLVLTGRDD